MLGHEWATRRRPARQGMCSTRRRGRARGLVHAAQDENQDRFRTQRVPHGQPATEPAGGPCGRRGCRSFQQTEVGRGSAVSWGEPVGSPHVFRPRGPVARRVRLEPVPARSRSLRGVEMEVSRSDEDEREGSADEGGDSCDQEDLVQSGQERLSGCIGQEPPAPGAVPPRSRRRRSLGRRRVQARRPAPAAPAVRLLGLRRAADPDHLAAVTTLVASGRDHAARSAGELGLAWGVGGSGT
jgi:hypothetical protein